jgi:hypothetical protein
MNTTKILKALSPCTRVKVWKFATAQGLSLAEAVIMCLEGETTKRVSAPER